MGSSAPWLFGVCAEQCLYACVVSYLLLASFEQVCHQADLTTVHLVAAIVSPCACVITHSDTCVICQTAYSAGDDLTHLPCLHAFHQDCITPWLQVSMWQCQNCVCEELQRSLHALWLLQCLRTLLTHLCHPPLLLLCNCRDTRANAPCARTTYVDETHVDSFSFLAICQITVEWCVLLILACCCRGCERTAEPVLGWWHAVCVCVCVCFFGGGADFIKLSLSCRQPMLTLLFAACTL